MRPQFRGRGDAGDERERSAGKNARFHSHWLEKMRLYGVVMCAGTCIRAKAVGGDGRSAPLRVQGHAECGHVRGVKLLGRTTRVVFVRARRRDAATYACMHAAMQAHRETNARIFFWPVIQLRALRRQRHREKRLFFWNLSNVFESFR